VFELSFTQEKAVPHPQADLPQLQYQHLLWSKTRILQALGDNKAKIMFCLAPALSCCFAGRLK